MSKFLKGTRVELLENEYHSTDGNEDLVPGIQGTVIYSNYNLTNVEWDTLELTSTGEKYNTFPFYSSELKDLTND